MPDRKTLNEDLFYRGSSANLPRLHTCENKVPFWDFSQFAVTLCYMSILENKTNATSHPNIGSFKTTIVKESNKMSEEFIFKACKLF